MKQHNIFKIITVMLVCLCLLGSTRAQGGIFNQNQAMTRNLIIQIGLFQTYLGYLKKGYDVANKGVNLVRDIKGGEFSLHKDYFSSLKTVNPKIKHYSKLAAIIALQLSIVRQYHGCLREAKSSGRFGADEIRYLGSVYSKLLSESAKELDDLMLLVTNGNLELTDDQRLERLDKLYEGMVDKHSFIQHFNGRVRSMAWQRCHALSEIHQGQILQGH